MTEPSAYAFHNDDNSILMLSSIGWQRIRNAEYSFDGNERPDSGHVIFQYTLSGQGWIEVDQQLIPLAKGSGFLVKVPGNYRYFYTPDSQPWEILWLNIRGAEAARIWDMVIAQEGHVIRREAGSPLITALWELLRAIGEDKVTDKYLLSAQVYSWLLTLVRTSGEISKDISAATSSIILKAKKYMRAHYAEPLTLDLLAEHCGVNKHHLCRLFQKSEQTSPLAYLRERRVEAAVSLLRTTDHSIQEIGRECGFDSPSYFGKVFRDYMSMTPKDYRLKKLEFPYDAIYYE
ncbi:helix-turn-helix domain-containing protein [Paenibacillus sp. FSL R7-0331]|uniref:helix-turn-helix domain-containing protein n=1 Tax=Paenibacillus sp. FSL R7-0331 TaxID=1536773 RepID=UPI0004F7CBD8|nr:AraC family transcriptional regulator [Paenibacillus sp. FSL R7-0331]AIQ51501.1 AraC family transcriptional regulator [Paenibacillus sp. FSL R7-0331]